MKLSKRILRAINEGVSTALMLDDTDVQTINRKSSKLISKDIKLNTEKALYSRKLLEKLPDPMMVNEEFIKDALYLYNKYGAQYNPHLDNHDFYEFIYKCVCILGVNPDLNWIDTSNITEMNSLFSYFVDILSINISDWDVSNVTSICRMFNSCTALKSLDLSKWDVSSIETIDSMFSGCKNLITIGDISNWNIANLKNACNAFNGCNKLKSIGDLSKWNRVDKTDGMFNGCSKLYSKSKLYK